MGRDVAIVNARRPVVGVVLDRKRASSGAWVDVEVDSIPHSYIHSVENAGALPITIPTSAAALDAADEVVEMLDGLFLSGGRDIDANLYGQEPRAGSDEPVTLRDELEIALVRAAVRAGVPILGACRGMQVINVALGGTLHQEISDIVDLTPHRHVVGEFTAHPVSVVPGSRLEEVARTSTFDIASHHHQAVDRVGEGLRVCAYAPDGIIEALELPGELFVLGVEWHPEERADAPGIHLFAAFIGAARHRRAQRRAAPAQLEREIR